MKEEILVLSLDIMQRDKTWGTRIEMKQPGIIQGHKQKNGPQRYQSMPQPSGPVSIISHGKRDFANMTKVKDFEKETLAWDI